jgi:hypothetical protein
MLAVSGKPAIHMRARAACLSIERPPQTGAWQVLRSSDSAVRSCAAYSRASRCISGAASPTEKIVAIFGMSLDEVLELMSIPFAEADLHERNLKLRVFECMMKAGLQFTRDREHPNARNETLEHLDAALRVPKQDVTPLSAPIPCCDALAVGGPAFLARR